MAKEQDKISIEEQKNKGSRTSIDDFKARNEEMSKEAAGKWEAREKGMAEFREQQRTPGVKQETLDVNVNVDGTNHQISKTEIQTVDTPKESTKETDSKTQDHSNPHLSEPTESQKEGMEHSFDMGIGEDGGVFDKLTEQIGSSIVEKATGNKENQQPEKSDKDLWKEMADEHAPPAPEEGKDKDKEMEIER